MPTPAPWLESDEEFEGVGAHRLNPRYDPVDEPVPQDKVRLSALQVPRYPMLSPVGRAALASAPYRLDGHDGSHHQYDAGPVDLGALAAATWIIWWKATQSTSYTDPTFLRVWGNRLQFQQRFAYHWISSTSDVIQQADHYLQIVGTIGRGDGAMLDAEEGGITAPGCLAWCERVEAVTQRPVSVYTGLYVAGGTIWKSDALRMSKYGPRPFHVAAYVTEDNLRARLISTGSQNYPWDAWQFSSNGPVPGITGRADMNRVDNRAAYDLATRPPNINPTPTEDDDMLRMLAPSDSPARFFAMCDNAARALRCEWTGPGDDQGSNPRVEFYRNAHPAGGVPFEMGLTVANLVNVSLDGVLPPGFAPEQFANPEEIRARQAVTTTTDQEARTLAQTASAQAAAAADQVNTLKSSIRNAVQ